MMEDVGMQDVHFNEVRASTGVGFQYLSISEPAVCPAGALNEGFSLCSCC